jgi:CheY-like chemotaxis protein
MAETGASAPAKNGCRGVLIVDDDPAIREVLKLILEVEGYAVQAACSGREALAVLHEAPTPCAIVLDLRMPDMDGWEFHERQVRDPAIAGIPVVVLSADRDAPQVAEQIGATSCLLKPVELDDVLGALRDTAAGAP